MRVPDPGELGPICLVSEEAARAFADIVVRTHDGIGVAGTMYEPGLVGAHDRDARVERVLAAVHPCFCVVFGQGPRERYVDAFEQMSDFARKLASDHIFPDGNKRTSLLVCLAMLSGAGAKLSFEDLLDPRENLLYRWIQAAVTGDMSVPELAHRLRRAARV